MTDTQTTPTKNIFLAGALLTLALLLLTAFTGQTQGIQAISLQTDDVIGSINGAAIYRSLYNNELALERVRYTIAGQPVETIDQARLISRIVEDTLLYQGAQTAGITIPEAELQQSLGDLLATLQFTRAEFETLLIEQGTTWAYFEASIRQYLVTLTFFNQVLMARAPLEAQPQDVLGQWLYDQYQTAEIQFEDAFLMELLEGIQ